MSIRHVILTAALILLARPATIVAQGRITVGTNVHVSSEHPKNWFSEVMLASDPSNRNALLACAMTSRPDQRYGETETVVYASQDGGRTWRSTLRVTGKISTEISSDPVCVFGPDHSAYYLSHYADASERDHTGVNPAVNPLYHSSDGGLTWRHLRDLPYADRPILVVDHRKTKARGTLYTCAIHYNVYAVGAATTPFSSLVLSRSIDNGQSFDPWAIYPGAGGSCGPADILADGRVIVPIRARPRGTDSVGRVLVAVPGERAPFEWKMNAYPATQVSPYAPCVAATTWSLGNALAVDHSAGPFANNTYIVWTDQRAGRCQIRLAVSRDGGITWSTPITVDDNVSTAGGGPDSFQPMVVVNKNGVVGVSWYDRREQPNGFSWRARFTASLDGGETFLPSVPVSTSRMQIGEGTVLTLRASSMGGAKLKPATPGTPAEIWFGIGGHSLTGGETSGLTADADGRFHMLWVDNRTGLPQLWTAPVTVSGVVRSNGATTKAAVATTPTAAPPVVKSIDGELAGMTDVTDRVLLTVDSVRADLEAGRITGRTILTNVGDVPVRGPFKARVLRVESKWGEVTFEDGGQDAILDWSGALEGGVLSVGAKSKLFVLTFTIKNTRPLTTEIVTGSEANRVNLDQLIRLEVQLLAHLGSASQKKK
jgi:hypothetical protein